MTSRVASMQDERRKGGSSHESGSDSEPEHLQYKVILLGDGAVGKTSLAVRFAEDAFNRSYKQTIGLDFFIKEIVLPGDVHVSLQLWDIGGQTIGGKMIGKYIHGAQAVLLVYDITNQQSFTNLEDWYALVRKAIPREKSPYVAVIANKADLTHIRAVRPERHNQFVDDHEMYSYFVSAKTGDKVGSTFYRIAADLAGVTLSRPEMEVVSKVVKAEIVNHPALEAEEEHSDSRRDGRCTIQ